MWPLVSPTWSRPWASFIHLIVCVSRNHELCYSSLIYGPTVFASTPIQTSQRRHLCMHTGILRRTIYWWFPGIYWDKQLIMFPDWLLTPITITYVAKNWIANTFFKSRCTHNMITSMSLLISEVIWTKVQNVADLLIFAYFKYFQHLIVVLQMWPIPRKKLSSVGVNLYHTKIGQFCSEGQSLLHDYWIQSLLVRWPEPVARTE